MKANILKFIFLIFGLTLEAQHNNPKIGIQAGSNLSYYTRAESSSPRIGFMIGGFLAYRIGRKLKIEPQLNYEFHKGAYSGEFDIYKNGKDGLYESMNIRASNTTEGFMGIPILIQYDLSQKLYLEIGPQFSLLLHSHFYDHRPDTNIVLPKKIYNSTQLLGVIGAGYVVSDKINVVVNTQIGLTNTSPNLPLVHNNAYSIVVQYRL